MKNTFLLIALIVLIGQTSIAYAGSQLPVCQAITQELNKVYSSAQADSYSLRMASKANLKDDSQLIVQAPFVRDDFVWTRWSLDSAETSPKSLNFSSSDKSKNEDLRLQINGFEWWRGLIYKYLVDNDKALQGSFHNAGPFGWLHSSFWNVFHFEDQAYVMATSGLYRPISVYLLDNSQSKEVCQVEPPISVDVKNAGLDLAYRHGLRYFMTDIKGHFGSAGSPYYSKNHDLMLDIIYRPTVHTEEFESSKEVDSFLYLAQSDAWSVRELGAAKNIASINRSYLEGYFRDVSRQLDANNLASLVLDKVYSDYDRKQLDEIGRSQLKQLANALSNDDSDSIVKSCQAIIRSKSFDYYHDNKRSMADCLSIVLDKPTVLDDLITECSGSTPNCSLSEVNAFGKNLLMYAAHMNNSKAVSTLLKIPELINARTINTARFDFPLAENMVTYGRTALMYAAENSSQRTIQLILDAGVDPNVKDSMGNNYFSYMDKNWRFNSSKARAYLSQSGPSFNCELATSTREKAICSDEMLSEYDRELSYLYSESYDQSPNSQALKTDQIRWLRNIDQLCSVKPNIVECISREYRERIRAFEFIVL
ncbi:ankyrin repeat domain-containing protein [Shewanella gaetbuli]|uniref:Ankyrin repeat domain-containing protein n=1 Tax=Shewanella gaetbuli TaxID=220752 RepID=A0A9X1ZK49_9GAMM|nr:ankyrin repeat domain-containing protein [Shewanella gaetbuli]MCL1143213.1 ankyrin repeat domain-containing protein [Shewanella gaetbuli]